MATVTFLEPGTDATQDLSFWQPVSNAGGATTVSASDQAHTGSYSIKSVCGGGAGASTQVYSPDGVCTDAGTAASIWVRFNTNAPSKIGLFFFLQQAGNGNLTLGIGLNATGTLGISGEGLSAVTSGSTVLSAATWYRVTLSYTIASASNWCAKVYINGVLEITVGNGATGLGHSNGTLSSTGSSEICVGVASDVAGNFVGAPALTAWFDDVYVDNRSDLSDPGNISVTAKRAFANGTTNGFSTTGTPSGYGSGHAPYVNGNYPVGSDTTTYVSVVVVVTAITEEYLIEGPTVGDANVSGATIVGVRGWVFASSTLTETDKIVVDGTQTSIAVTATASLFTQNSATPTVYPAGTGTDIGFVTNTTAATAKVFGAGVLIAFIPASGGPTVDQIMAAMQQPQSQPMPHYRTFMIPSDSETPF